MKEVQIDEVVTQSRPIVRIFWCYALQNQELCDKLERHISALKLSGYILTWHEGEILPGSLREQVIESWLDAADLVLPLVSSDFLSSTYDGKEMRRAFERLNKGEVRIVPILASPVNCQGTLLSDLQMLPTDGIPIMQWTYPEEACADVAKGISRVVDVVCAKKWKQQGDVSCCQEAYDLALAAYEKAILLDPHSPYFYDAKGTALMHLQRFEEAITAYSKATDLKPDFGSAWRGKGNALDAFAPLAREKYKRLAEQSYQQATLLEKRLEGGMENGR